MDYSGGDNKAGNFNQAPERADDFIIKQGEHNSSALGKEAMAAGKAPGDYSEASDSTAENEGTMPLSMPPETEISIEKQQVENEISNNITETAKNYESKTSSNITETAKKIMNDLEKNTSEGYAEFQGKREEIEKEGMFKNG